MFDVGFFELVLLFVIGLLILGPERLPRVASQIGRWVGRARRTAMQLRYQLEREMTLSDIDRSKRQRAQKPPPADSASDSQAGGDEGAATAAPQADESAGQSASAGAEQAAGSDDEAASGR